MAHFVVALETLWGSSSVIFLNYSFNLLVKMCFKHVYNKGQSIWHNRVDKNNNNVRKGAGKSLTF